MSGTYGSTRPRAPRAPAWSTAAVFGGALVVGEGAAPALVAAQATVVAASTPRSPGGPRFHDPVAARLATPVIGLFLALVALAGAAGGSALLLAVATGAALTVAVLDAALGVHLGHELHLILRRVGASGSHPAAGTVATTPPTPTTIPRRDA